VALAAHDVTHLLQAWSAGDEEALEKLTPLVYDELHRTARRYLAGEGSGNTLQTTALINEVYLRLVDFRKVTWQNRAKFFGICAQLMRRILFDLARSRRSYKRGGDAVRLPLDEALLVSSEPPADLIDLDDALNKLANIDDRKSRVIELRFFGGLSVEETAEVLGVSSETVMLEWKTAKVWLLHRLREQKRHDA
jgi:RNA polymerase sigma factor (TIGR02999 family)